jgi:hypothetical protein
MAGTEPRPAPELAAAMAETRIYRELLEEVLATFEKGTTGDGGWYSRVESRQIRKWRERAGIRAAE